VNTRIEDSRPGPLGRPRTTAQRRLLLARMLVALGLAASVLILPLLTDDSAAAATPQFPDLGTLPPRDLRFDRADVDPSSTTNLHNVLRFSNTVYNSGEGPLAVSAAIDPATKAGPSVQKVLNPDGTMAEQHTVGRSYYHAVHDHYHFDDWGEYQLWTKAQYDLWISSGRSQGQFKAVGTKTTSCIVDEEFTLNTPLTPYPRKYMLNGCDTDAQGNLNMGISVGWGDTYDYYRAEQWIDLGQETLADGDYVLRSVTDPKNLIYESGNKGDNARESELDNDAATPFRLNGGQLVDLANPSGTVSVNHVDESTTSTSVSVDVVARDDVSGVDAFRLSNDGSTWQTFDYTSAYSTPTTVAWDLANQYGGSQTTGPRTVYAQTKDRSGKWSSTFTDTIRYGTVAGGTPYSNAVAGDGPAGYWRLDETSGVTAADLTGNGPGTYRNGAVVGGAGLLAAEPIRKAVSLDGVNDFVAIASSSNLSPTQKVTVESWVKPNKLPAAGSYSSLVAKRGSYYLQLAGPRLEFGLDLPGGRRRLLAPAEALTVGATAHVVGVYDGATMKLYVNGKEVASSAQSGLVAATSNGLQIGAWTPTTEFLSGTLDEVAVYPVALSASRVSAHYNLGTSSSTPSNLLTVVPQGSGSGSVSSTPAGIKCPSVNCTSEWASGTKVTLTPTAAAGSNFTSWEGDCSGTGACVVTMDAAKKVFANFSPISSGSEYVDAVTADAPVGFWRLNETSGTVAGDRVNANNGTFRNGVILGAAGLLPTEAGNTAASFDGTNDSVSVPNSSILSPTQRISVEAWVNPSSLPDAGTYRSVLSKRGAYTVQFSGPRLEFALTQAGGVRKRLQAPSGALVAGRSYHVVGTYDGATQRLFVNGAQVASVPLTGGIATSTDPVQVASFTTTSEFLGGVVDEPALFASALSAARVAAHYAAGT